MMMMIFLKTMMIDIYMYRMAGPGALHCNLTQNKLIIICMMPPYTTYMYK